MAEKPLVPASEKLPVKSFTQRLGFSNEPSPNAKYLRAILTFLREAGSEQIKQIPVFGPMLAGASAAIEELSKEEDESEARAACREAAHCWGADAGASHVACCH